MLDHDKSDPPIHLANIYIPSPNSEQDKRERLAVVNQLISDILSLPPKSRYLVCGDFNADPFRKTGANLPLLKQILRGTALMRPANTCFTRRNAANHVDNFLVSPETRRYQEAPGNTEYYSTYSFGTEGKGSTRKKSQTISQSPSHYQ